MNPAAPPQFCDASPCNLSHDTALTPDTAELHPRYPVLATGYSQPSYEPVSEFLKNLGAVISSKQENVPMKFIAAFAIYIFLSSPALGQTAPFCVVSQTGQQSCFYHTLDACQQAAATMNGACATNSRAQGSTFYDVNKAIEKPDIAGSFQRGQAEGQRLKLERERRQAEMALLAAQADTLKAAKRQETNDGYWVMYKCPDANGNLHPSGIPAPGCIVDFVTAY